jgi:hypothetical protein
MPTINLLMALSIAGAMLAFHTPAQAQTAGAELPVSLERIRAALEGPPPVFSVPAPRADEVPTFRVEVRQLFVDLEPDREEPFDPTYGLPSVGELLMGGVGRIRSAAAGYKQRRAKRRARQEVADALAEFCAVHTCAEPGSRK